jgi:DNA-binding MarR family transcriptional regulator
LTFLTDRGREVCQRIAEIWRDADARLRRRLSRSDAATLEALLASVLDPAD